MTVLHRATPERLSAFSDAVFAVLITVLVLELRPPEFPTFKALLLLWPTWLSYAVSYLFIAIVWTNHHYLMRYATEATPRLLWFNFAHLFSMSLLPLSTAWMAVSKLAPQPVAFYAAVFFLVNATYISLIWELIDRGLVGGVSPTLRRIMRLRSITTLCLFGVAAVVALKYPLAGLWGLSGWRGNERIADSIKKGPPGARAGGGCCSGSDRAPNFQGSAGRERNPVRGLAQLASLWLIACPASKLRHTCSDHCCRMGADCRELDGPLRPTARLSAIGTFARRTRARARDRRWNPHTPLPNAPKPDHADPQATVGLSPIRRMER